MKNKEGCDTKVRILALERILQGTDKPLSTEEIMDILEKQYRIHGNRHTFGYFANKCEIIGNIHDNPELME